MKLSTKIIQLSRRIFLFVILLFFSACITTDESGRIIEGPKFLMKENKIKKWQLSEIPLGPRWNEKEKEIPILLTPRKPDLLDKFILLTLPPVMDQGPLASSTAFATGYLAFSYYIHQNRKIKEYICSPSFLYNLLNNGKDEGIEILDTLFLLKDTGCAPIHQMPYNPYDFKMQPPPDIVKIASDYKLQNFARIDPLDVYQMASFISNHQIVISTIYISENFINLKHDTYEPEGKFLGKHTIGIIGYDMKENKYYIQNSNGKNWGNKGYVWIPIEWYRRLVINAYVIIN